MNKYDVFFSENNPWGIAKTIADELGCKEQHCFVVFRESPTEHNFYVGDGFLTPFNPAAHKSKLWGMPYTLRVTV